jgi:glycosyltransferase involved in cell wall biosynthesis
MKVTIVSRSDLSGGASRAAFQLHKALVSSGVQSRMRVAVKKSDLHTVDGPRGKVGIALALVKPTLGGLLMHLQRSSNRNFHSVSILPSGLNKELNHSGADVLNLHWVNGEFLSIGAIGKLSKPVVWTLHDMWAFSGAEHYGPDNNDARWRTGYRSDNRPAGDGGLDIDRWVWGRKRKAWQHPINIVTASAWLAGCAKDSVLMHDWPVTVIPNPMNMSQFQPWPKEQARAILNLPAAATLILFGAIGASTDLRKGWDLLQPALESLAARKLDAEVVVFGQSAPSTPPRLGLPAHWMGFVNDDVTLALLYSAADVMVVPSRQESLPQSGTEAQACGCPVVTFNSTGLPDVVAHQETGYLAEPYDHEDLARGIRWVLEDRERHSHLREAARKRALHLWSPESVVSQYMQVYEAAIEAHHK